MKRCLRCEARYDAPGWRCPACGFEPDEVLGIPAFAADLQAADIRYDASRFDASSELRVGRAVNRVLGAVMALERRLLEAGLTLRVGGSLLVVAHKP